MKATSRSTSQNLFPASASEHRLNERTLRVLDGASQQTSILRRPHSCAHPCLELDSFPSWPWLAPRDTRIHQAKKPRIHRSARRCWLRPQCVDCTKNARDLHGERRDCTNIHWSSVATFVQRNRVRRDEVSLIKLTSSCSDSFPVTFGSASVASNGVSNSEIHLQRLGATVLAAESCEDVRLSFAIVQIVRESHGTRIQVLAPGCGKEALNVFSPRIASGMLHEDCLAIVVVVLFTQMISCSYRESPDIPYTCMTS